MAINRYYIRAERYKERKNVGSGFTQRQFTDKELKRYNRLRERGDLLELHKRDISYNARRYTINLSVFKTLLVIVVIYVLFNFLIDPTFEFSFVGLINQLNTIPTINMSSIGNWDFPNWLDWLEPIAKALGIVVSCIINIALIIVWLIMMLFGVTF